MSVHSAVGLLLPFSTTSSTNLGLNSVTARVRFAIFDLLRTLVQPPLYSYMYVLAQYVTLPIWVWLLTMQLILRKKHDIQSIRRTLKISSKNWCDLYSGKYGIQWNLLYIIMHPPARGQPLSKGHWLRHRLGLL